jgi:threonine synthase
MLNGSKRFIPSRSIANAALITPKNKAPTLDAASSKKNLKSVGDACIVVSLDETEKTMRLMAEKARIISEGAGALPVAAALPGKARSSRSSQAATSI